MPINDRLVCAIMAGGSGTRFWPLSRQNRPKQLLSLLEPRSLLRATVDRIAPVCPPERTLVITAQRLLDATRAAVPDLPPHNIIAEPEPRNTAPCMALAAIAAQQIDPNAIVALLPADHHVADAQAFRTALLTAANHADTGCITTLGIVPTRPETGYGYIELGESNKVARFVEKPDLQTALTYLAGGKHLWNGGIFVTRADTALTVIAEHQPAITQALAPLQKGEFGRYSELSFLTELAQRFGQCPSISIDYGIAEKRTDLRTVRLDAGWSDVGTWASLVHEGHATGSSFIRGDVLELGDETGSNNLLRNDLLRNDLLSNDLLSNNGCVLISDGPLIAAIGLKNMAVIATPDAVLVMPLDRSQDVRKVVAALQKKGRNELL